MAIIKVGAPLAGIRGTIGGITYSENHSGTYAKKWSMPSNPKTPRQTAERGYLARMPSLWNELTDDQRADWRSFAADPAQEKTNPLGESYYASGYNWFCQCNVSLIRVGRATIKPSPTQAQPAAPTINDFRVCVAGDDPDLCVGGVASASTSHPAQPASNAFDDILGTYWLTAISNTTGWLKYALPAARNVKRYRIYQHGAPSPSVPKDWTFQVFTGGDWVTLQSVNNYVFVADEWANFYAKNPYNETDYRINVTQNDGDPDYVGIFEVEMMKAGKGQSVIIYPEDNFEDAPSYDLVMHVSMGNSIGMGVQYPGFYEVLAKQDPDRWDEPFQAELEAAFGQIMASRSWYARLYRQTREGYRSAVQAARTVTIGG